MAQFIQLIGHTLICLNSHLLFCYDESAFLFIYISPWVLPLVDQMFLWIWEELLSDFLGNSVPLVAQGQRPWGISDTSYWEMPTLHHLAWVSHHCELRSGQLKGLFSLLIGEKRNHWAKLDVVWVPGDSFKSHALVIFVYIFYIFVYIFCIYLFIYFVYMF